jgi:hypothetical protein
MSRYQAPLEENAIQRQPGRRVHIARPSVQIDLAPATRSKVRAGYLVRIRRRSARP